jgi:nitrogen fixation/metabolism regulation signal transduction histidine kinase
MVKGHEMGKFLAAVTLMVVALIATLIAYYSFDATRTLNRTLDKTRTEIERDASDVIRLNSEGIARLTQIPEVAGYFSTDFISRYLTGDLQPTYDLITYLAGPLFGAQAIVVEVDGRVVADDLPAGVTAQELAIEQPDADYAVLRQLGAQRGYFVLSSVPIELPETTVQPVLRMVIDRTDAIQAVEEDFHQDRNDLLTRQLAVGGSALLVSLAAVLIGIRLLNTRYVSGPITSLTRQAKEVMEGSFEGRVEVNPDSDYAPLQSLLSSGQTLLKKMDEEQEPE